MGSEPILALQPAVEEAPAAPVPASSRWRRFRQHRLAVVGLAVFALLLLVSFLGPEVWRYGVEDLTDASSSPPSLDHPFGTDELGHDWLALVLNGSRRSLQIALMVACISTAVGTCWGAVAGLYGRRVDAVMMRVADLALMLPLVVVGAVLAGSGSGSWWMLGLILGLLLSPIVSRVVRAEVLSLRDREFVEAARVLGATRTRIIVHHLLPNVAGTVIVAATLAVAVGVLAETSLSFLGFGVRPPDTSLGLLVSEAAVAVNTRPWLFYAPGLFIIAIALSVNFVGDGLRDTFDPRQGARRAAAGPGHDGDGAPAPGAAAAPDVEALLAVDDLSVRLRGESGVVHAVRGVSWSVSAGEVLAIVGESGSGKSATALAVMGLLPRSAQVRGSIRLGGRELLGASDRELSDVRGDRIALIPQDPQTALNPVHRVGDQIAEVVLAHAAVSREQARARAVDLLAQVGIPDPELRARHYPRQLSGGMRQRVAIAAAMANDPDVIVADEPTTALDVTVQAQILDALMAARARTGAALVIITHDLGVVAGVADRVLIMYAGKVVESAAVGELFASPRMPYTLGLLGSLPRIDAGRAGRRLTPIPGGQPSLAAPPDGCAFAPRCPLAREVCRLQEPPLAGAGRAAACHFADEVAGADPEEIFAAPLASATERPREPAAGPPVLEVRDLVKTFQARHGLLAGGESRAIHAVRGISLQLRRGETLGIAGESGCGKSTLTRLILGLEEPTAGVVVVHGRDVTKLSERRRRVLRSELQVVFQDPYASLDPRATVGTSIAEPLRIHGRDAAASRARVAELLDLVGLPRGAGERYPHELSGGQRQRVAIARALALDPDVVLLDEPTSALDASIQAGVLNLLDDVQRELGLSYVFISHDLAVLRHVCDRVAVMYLGQIVETAPADELFAAPRHPYTQALIAAAPIPDPGVQRARSGRAVDGDPPNPASPPDGCAFRTRCPRYALHLDEPARARCREVAPPPVEPGADHRVSCHHPAPLPPL